MTQLQIVILAGGLGKRMESSFPKVLHLVQDKPMCEFFINFFFKHDYNIYLNNIIIYMYYNDISSK